MARRPSRPNEANPSSGRSRFDSPNPGGNSVPPQQHNSSRRPHSRSSAPRDGFQRGGFQRDDSQRDNFPRDNFQHGGFPPNDASHGDFSRGGGRSSGRGSKPHHSSRPSPRSAPKQSAPQRAEKRSEERAETIIAARVPSPSMATARDSATIGTLFVPQFPASFAALENEHLFLNPLEDDALRAVRQEQALMLHLAERQAVSLIPSGFVLEKFAPEKAAELPIKTKEIAAKPRSKRLQEGDGTSTPDAQTPPKPVKRPQPIDEPADVKSPFGDVIETMQEVLIARNGGRYVPLPKSSEKPRPPGVDLHPAIGFKLYSPNPHKPAQSAQPSPVRYESRHRRSQQRPERVYPAAVPLDAVFDTMPTATTAFHQRLQNILRYEAELPLATEIVVAVSGGVDSLVLLDMLMCISRQTTSEAQGKRSLSIAVVHFNHRLRGVESEQDANFVRETCKRYDIPCYIAWADVGRFAEIQSMSLEQAGRELRYKFLEFVAYKRRADAVLTAHTLNDSVETVLMNMLRGSGLTGLSGIPAQRAFGDHTKLVRPLLSMKKAEIQEYAALRGLSWREDSSNSQSVFRRNKIRNELLPLLEREYSSGIVDVLNRTSQIILGADELVRETVERILPSLLVEEEFQPYIGLNITALRVQKRFLQSELVRHTVQRRFGLTLSFDAVDRILALVEAEVGTKADVMRGFVALRDRTMIVLAPAPGVYNLNVRVEKNNHYDFGGWRIFLEEIDRKNVKFTADPAVEFINTDILPYRMTLRTWQPGDVFTPLGMKGTMKVSDYLTNSKISFFNRQNVLVLVAAMPEGEQIVWLCGLRMSEQFRLPNDAPKALRLEFRRPKGVILPAPPQEKG